MFVMHASIEHQADSAEHFVRQAAIIRIRVLIKANIFSEALRIERPALDVTGVASLLAKWRKTRQRLRNGNLHVMTRDAFVVRGGFDGQERAVLEVAGVDVNGAGP